MKVIKTTTTTTTNNEIVVGHKNNIKSDKG
jgi:hypothetical protein